MHKLHRSPLPKIVDNFFKNISNIHSYKTRFADNQNYFMQKVSTNSGKKYFLKRGCALEGNPIESVNLAVCHFLQTL